VSNRNEIRRAGVAGWPVTHSRSPIIHQHWLREFGIEARYERFAIRPGEFPSFAIKIGRDGLVGSNVTIPHKEAAFAACDRRTAVAETLRSVNTLWREDGLLWGDNTDVEGFLANMDEAAPGWAESTRAAVVIGAGGTARAVIGALALRGLQRIAIVNRTHERAVALAERFRAGAIALPWRALPSELSWADLLVNASSLGMRGEPPLNVGVNLLPNHAVVADIVYVPLHTPLIETARARGLRVAEGLGMLLHQAAPAFEKWFGQRPVITRDLRTLVEADIVSER